jgi:tRNA nucleotidyltransferase (CCA-adding enzyme)
MALRCVGNPDERFNEDALRILRGLRFASAYNFSIESNTAMSIIRNRKLLNNISMERIASELNGILCGKNVNFILRRYKDVIAVLIPEIVSTFDFAQNTPHHNKTVWRHTTAAVANIEPDNLLRMVMLLHDIGKPLALRTDENGRDHFKGHNHFSAVLAKTALKRLKYPTKFIEDAVTLIEYHDVRFSDSKKQIKHVMNIIGIENFKRLMKIQKADILAQSKYMQDAKLKNLNLACYTFEGILRRNECYKIKDLKINGSDLIHLGITDGKTIGDILEILLDNVIDETIKNDSIDLKIKAFEIYKDINN